MENGNYRHTVRQLYDFIQSHLYFNRPDIRVGGEQFNSTLLFTLLTALTGGKALIIGEPGLGKTTAAEYAGSLLYQLRQTESGARRGGLVSLCPAPCEDCRRD